MRLEHWVDSLITIKRNTTVGNYNKHTAKHLTEKSPKFLSDAPLVICVGESITEQFAGSDHAKPAFLWDLTEMQIEKDWERSSLISLQCSKVTCWCYQLCSWVNQSLRLWWQKSVDIGYLKKIIPASSTSWPSVNWRPWMNSHYETLWIK